MKVRKLTYKMKKDLTKSLELMGINMPRVIPYADYSYHTVRVMIGRIEKESNARFEYYNAPDGTIVKKIRQ